MTGRQGEQLRRRVIGQAVFGNGVFTGLAHPGNSFRARPESPLRATAGPGIRWLRPPKSTRVRRLRLRFELRNVTSTASAASDVARTCLLRVNGHNSGGKDTNRQPPEPTPQNSNRSAS